MLSFEFFDVGFGSPSLVVLMRKSQLLVLWTVDCCAFVLLWIFQKSGLY
jgi:hypothetical protein